MTRSEVDNSVQANAYVSEQVSDAFDSYSRSCGLTSKSELLKLLIERELRLRRLSRSGASLVRHRHPVGRGSKITTHLPSRVNERFDAHTRTLGFSKSAATAFLIETELSERWLETAIEWEPA